MGVVGLFLSGFFYFFPVSDFVFLCLLGLVLLLAGQSLRLLGVFLGGSFLAGVLLFPPDHPSPPQRSLTVDICLDSLPSLSNGGLWVTGTREGSDPMEQKRVKLFIPKDRLPPEPLVWGDCLSGQIDPLPLPQSGFPLPSESPSYILPVSGSLEVLPSSSPVSHLVRSAFQLTRELSTRLREDYPPDVAGLLSALVLSDTRFLMSETMEDFRQSGISHLLSVSGEHMTLLSLSLGGAFLLLVRIMPLSLLRTLSVRLPVSRTLFVLLLPVLGIYTLMIGLPPAAARAYLAFSLLAILRLLFVDLEFSEILGLSTLLMLAFAPSLARSLSFLLSLLALWGLVMHQRHVPEPGRKKPGSHPLRESFQAGLIITLLTAPLLALVFRTMNPAGIIANPVIVPVAGDLLLPLGFLDLLLLLILPHTPTIVLLLTGSLAHIVLGLAGGFARLPGSEVKIPGGNPVLVLLFYLAVILLLVTPTATIRRVFLPLFFLFLAAILLPGSKRTGQYFPAAVPDVSGHLAYQPGRERENLSLLLSPFAKSKIHRKAVQ